MPLTLYLQKSGDKTTFQLSNNNHRWNFNEAGNTNSASSKMLSALAKTLHSFMYSQEQIDNFIKEKTGIDELKPNDDLLNDQGVRGDDFHEMIDEYAKRFNVDMTGYLWYFHADEEGGWNSIGGSFFKPPYERVTYIPVTPALLLDMANKGRWYIQYPPHKLPKKRWDIIINQILFIIVIAWALYSCLK